MSAQVLDPLPRVHVQETLYDNLLDGPDCVEGFILEGEGSRSFPMGRLRLDNQLDPELGQAANIVYWCPETFPDHIRITWDFLPVREPGLAILFFAAAGHDNKDLFDPSLASRNGPYDQYHHGDLDALHVSYFRRKAPTERAFQTCNLRKSHGFHLVAQGADPLPGIGDVTTPYPMTLIKSGPVVHFAIRELTIFSWMDPGTTYGPTLTGGRIGFRQMAPLIAEYSNLRVDAIDPLA